MKPLPCKQCPCIAICRGMYFMDMKNKCSLVWRFLYTPGLRPQGLRREDFDNRIEELFRIMNPLYWSVKKIPAPDSARGYNQAFSYRKAANHRVTSYFSYSGPAE